ncbi:hypothetical protein LTR17_025617 [Elasticomyces elasticus]|nr:hypothetical protein LTR17_025617 [Elasticomyces elasticus]
MQALVADNGFARDSRQQAGLMPDLNDDEPEIQQLATNLVNTHNVQATGGQRGSLACEWCGEIFTKRRTLTRHKIRGTKRCPSREHGSSIETCTFPGCNRTFARPDTRKRHEDEKHYGKKRPAPASHRMPLDPTAYTSTSVPGSSVVTRSNALDRSFELGHGYHGADARESTLLTTTLSSPENVESPITVETVIDPLQTTVAEPMTTKASSNHFRAAGSADDDAEVPSTMMSPFWTRMMKPDVFQPVLPGWQNLSPAPEIEENCNVGPNWADTYAYADGAEGDCPRSRFTERSGTARLSDWKKTLFRVSAKIVSESSFGGFPTQKRDLNPKVASETRASYIRDRPMELCTYPGCTQAFTRRDTRKRHEYQTHHGKKQLVPRLNGLPNDPRPQLGTSDLNPDVALGTRANHGFQPVVSPSCESRTRVTTANEPAHPAVASWLPSNGGSQDPETIVNGHLTATVEIPAPPGPPAEVCSDLLLWDELAFASWELDPVWTLPSGIDPVHDFASCWDSGGPLEGPRAQPSTIDPTLNAASESDGSRGSESWEIQDWGAEGNRPVPPTGASRLSNNTESLDSEAMAKIYLATAVEVPVLADPLTGVCDDWLLWDKLASPSWMLESDWSLPVNPDIVPPFKSTSWPNSIATREDSSLSSLSDTDRKKNRPCSLESSVVARGKEYATSACYEPVSEDEDICSTVDQLFVADREPTTNVRPSIAVPGAADQCRCRPGLAGSTKSQSRPQSPPARVSPAVANISTDLSANCKARASKLPWLVRWALT